MDRLLTSVEGLDIAIGVFGSRDGIIPKFPERGEKIQEFSKRIAQDQDLKTRQQTLREVGEIVGDIWDQEENRTTDMNKLIEALLRGELPDKEGE